MQQEPSTAVVVTLVYLAKRLGSATTDNES